MNPMKKVKGYSLVELVTAIAILGVVTTICVTAYFRITELEDQTYRRTELDTVAENALKTMTQDFADVLSPGLAGQRFQGVQQTVLGEKDLAGASLANDQVTFPVQLPTREESRRVSGMVTYHVDRNTNDLVRMTGSLFEEFPVSGPTTVASGVVHLAFEYRGREDGGQWVREWSKEGLPGAVRVTLVVMDKDRPFEQVARRAVFPLHVE